jgi:hypothetical protein
MQSGVTLRHKVEKREATMSAFDPREAADLLDSIERDARRRFDPRPPLVGLFSALVVLAIYGTLWLSVRHQHPYVGPTDTATAWAYTILAASIVVSVSTYRRATQGITGPSRRQDAIAWLAIGVPWIAVYLFNAALARRRRGGRRGRRRPWPARRHRRRPDRRRHRHGRRLLRPGRRLGRARRGRLRRPPDPGRRALRGAPARMIRRA